MRRSITSSGLVSPTSCLAVLCVPCRSRGGCHRGWMWAPTLELARGLILGLISFRRRRLKKTSSEYRWRTTHRFRDPYGPEVWDQLPPFDNERRAGGPSLQRRRARELSQRKG